MASVKNKLHDFSLIQLKCLENPFTEKSKVLDGKLNF